VVEVPEYAGRLMRYAAEYALAEAVGDCNFIINDGSLAGQTVPHLHIHVVPRRPDDGLAMPWPSPQISQRSEMSETPEDAEYAEWLQRVCRGETERLQEELANVKSERDQARAQVIANAPTEEARSLRTQLQQAEQERDENTKDLVTALRTANRQLQQAEARLGAALTALREQWEANHAEHCSNMVLHTAGDKDCHWPMPAALSSNTLEEGSN
jgi:diadenosine tetraphosphate (Ap4A) HIT family hydrolase